MTIDIRPAPIVALGLVMALGGCLGSGSGGGGGAGGGSGSADYETAYDEVTSRIATSDMPTSIDATYEGQFKVGVNSGSAEAFGSSVTPSNAEIIGDLSLAVDWTDGQTSNPFTGSATNIVATDVVSGDSIQLQGTLNVDSGQPASVSRLPVIPGVDTGSMMVSLTGDVANGDDEGRVYLGLTGQFYGPGGNAMQGVVTGGINDMDDPDAQIFDAAIGGSFYATQ
ncbi:MAG: hypothetical protein GYB53_12590 [Rhodobacteraceae bacterium]|nr:hypothetical protein [Paracoccaceae bacterium]MBR9822898.1 hypothetical protein [Paracoccaceae bacterium]